MASDRLVNALQDLAAVLQTQTTLGAALAAIAEAATVSVPGCDACTIGLSVEGRPATAAASARLALELDLVQYETDEGPCLTSFRTMELLRIDIAEATDVFPHFARAAEARGVVAVMSVPATIAAEIVGTLNLYSRSGPFDEAAVSVAAVLAAQVAIAINRSPEFAAARTVADEAQRAADERTEVGIATGLLMVNEECTAEQAELLLERAAEDEEQTIVEIARRIIEHHTSRKRV